MPLKDHNTTKSHLSITHELNPKDEEGQKSDEFLSENLRDSVAAYKPI